MPLFCSSISLEHTFPTASFWRYTKREAYHTLRKCLSLLFLNYLKLVSLYFYYKNIKYSYDEFLESDDFETKTQVM